VICCEAVNRYAECMRHGTCKWDRRSGSRFQHEGADRRGFVGEIGRGVMRGMARFRATSPRGGRSPWASSTAIASSASCEPNDVTARARAAIVEDKRSQVVPFRGGTSRGPGETSSSWGRFGPQSDRLTFSASMKRGHVLSMRCVGERALRSRGKRGQASVGRTTSSVLVRDHKRIRGPRPRSRNRICQHATRAACRSRPPDCSCRVLQLQEFL